MLIHISPATRSPHSLPGTLTPLSLPQRLRQSKGRHRTPGQGGILTRQSPKKNRSQPVHPYVQRHAPHLNHQTCIRNIRAMAKVTMSVVREILSQLLKTQLNTTYHILLPPTRMIGHTVIRGISTPRQTLLSIHMDGQLSQQIKRHLRRRSSMRR